MTRLLTEDIRKQIDIYLQDIHILYSNDVLSTDLPYYNQVVTILDNTQRLLNDADTSYKFRNKAMMEKYNAQK